METQNRLRDLRQRKNLTLKQASSRLGISDACLSLYERGIREPNIDMMKRLAEFYGRTPQYIFFSD